LINGGARPHARRDVHRQNPHILRQLGTLSMADVQIAISFGGQAALPSVMLRSALDFYGGGPFMRTTILAYVIALVGLGTIAVGAWDLIILLTDAPVEEVSLSDLAIAVGIVAGGFGLIGLAQVLRLLRVIYGELQPWDWTRGR
jgi:hypothetical protein